ncbi:unnamed protein product [Heligmosomoides polygyrus]|uniref:PDZ domain-containing protein n=1 Tax=Heligmosomoides polygyrus TaxID=6339 RepID=A0A183G310_HELPZ|nr:unnamed protein product [Heligmosomoides polygyrus]
MKQVGVLRSSGEILPDAEGQGAQHQIQVVPVTNSFAGAKMFREGEVVSTYDGIEMTDREPLWRRRVVEKARAPKPTNIICGRQTVFNHPRRESGVRSAELSRVAEAVSILKPEAKRGPRKARSSLPEVSRNSKENAPAVTRIPQPRVVHTQRKRVIKMESVGRRILAKEGIQRQLLKVNDGEDDYVKTVMGEVRAELTRYLSALQRRLEAVVCCHYSEVLET